MRCYLSWVSQLVLNTFQSDPTGFAVTHSLHTISLSQNCIFHSQSIWSCSAHGLTWLPLLRSSSSFAGIAKTSQLLPSVLDLSWRSTWRLWSVWRSIYWTRSLYIYFTCSLIWHLTPREVYKIKDDLWILLFLRCLVGDFNNVQRDMY